MGSKQSEIASQGEMIGAFLTASEASLRATIVFSERFERSHVSLIMIDKEGNFEENNPAVIHLKEALTTIKACRKSISEYTRDRRG